MLYRNGYDRRKSPEMIDARPMTAAEFLALEVSSFGRVRGPEFGEFLFEGNGGAARRCRANGALKTWKTRPGDFRLPVKYGLRECSAIVPRNGLAVIEGTGRPVLVRL